jgi:hypothetical protein
MEEWKEDGRMEGWKDGRMEALRVSIKALAGRY